MTESDKVFAGSITKFYDALMVPLIFAAYVADSASTLGHRGAAACNASRCEALLCVCELLSLSLRFRLP